MMLTADYLPGKENVVADQESRVLKDASDWKLNPQIFRRISKKWGPFSIDLFAARHNKQVPTYFGWRPDPEAAAVNAMVQEWSALTPYAFPPFVLIGRTLLKMNQDQVSDGCLIVPLWRAQPWFPLLLEMTTDFPVVIPMQEDTLMNPDHEPRPLNVSNHLQLVAWRVSGVPSKAWEFRKSLQVSSLPHGGKERNQATQLHGTSGVAGVIGGISILFHHL